MPAPSAEISALISSFSSIRLALVFSTFRIFPRSGRIAWNFRSRPCFADPPADSPSTMNSSLSRGSRSWQSASFSGERGGCERALAPRHVARLPGRFPGLEGIDHLGGRWPWLRSGSPRRSAPVPRRRGESTKPCTLLLPSFVLVWPSNWGSGTRTLMTAARPTRASSPWMRALSSFPRRDVCA